MSARPRLLLSCAAALAALACLPSGASAAADWRCEAGAVSGTALGVALDPVRAGALGDDCATRTASLDALLPVPLDAGAVLASTSATADGVLAAGGVADLRVRSLPSLPVQLPAVTIPESLGAVEVPLPSSPLLPLLPSSVTVDLRPALNALVPDRQLPALDLVAIKGAVAYAAARCLDRRAVTSGIAQVAGLSVLGQDTPVDQVVDQTVTLLSAGSIDPSDIDLALVAIPSVTGISDAVLRPIVEAALRPILDGLPPIAIPATLAQVKLTPGEQSTDAGVLTQRALRVVASIAGQPVADLTLGRASVAAGAVDCAPGNPVEQAASPVEAALACTTRKLALVDVLPRRNSVLLTGAADRSLAGRTVDVVFEATGKVVARAVVAADGSFRTTAPLPARSVRGTNRARYRAQLGDERSINLKLMRRMVVTTAQAQGPVVTIRGRVIRPLASPRADIVVRRRTSCTTSEEVARVKPELDGTFEVSFLAPANQVAPVYRLSTRVRMSRRSRTTFPTFTLPRAIDVG